MAHVLRHTYRWSERDDDGNVVQHVANAGTPVSDLPKEVQEAVKGTRAMTVDEKRFDAANNNILPLSALEDAEEQEVEVPRYTPVRSPQSQIGDNRSQEERVKQATQLAQGDANEASGTADDSDDKKSAKKSTDKK